MSLSVKASWSKPVDLIAGKRGDDFIYDIEEKESIPEKPGVYIFARMHGNSISPIYIGQAGKLKQRIKQQLDSVKLMRGIKNSPRGYRVLLYCVANLKRGQTQKTVLNLIENALIDHVLSQGCELLNKQGAKRPAHVIEFNGNRDSEKIAPRKMFIQSR